jgi:hypothetical protein
MTYEAVGLLMAGAHEKPAAAKGKPHAAVV